MKKILVLLLTLLLLSGCGTKDTSGSDGVFWIVTELSTSDGMNYQAETALETLQEKYPDVTFKLEILPTGSAERENYIQTLQTQILAGEGPDVYLLPTGDTLTIDANRKSHTDQVAIEPLFSDVALAMRTGVFTDIQRYYERDTELNTAGLRQEVMDAGMVGNARYVLPLRYNMPILLVNSNTDSIQNMVQNGITPNSAVTDLVNHALDTGDTRLAVGLQLPKDTSVFPELFDYDKGVLLVTQEEIVHYLSLYQQWYAASHSSETEILRSLEKIVRAHYDEVFHYSFPDVLEELGITITRDSLNFVNRYQSSGYAHWTAQELPVFATSLNGLLDSAILEKAMEQDWEELPLGRMDGSVGAEVTYFGAVGASCDDLEMAYEYLRLFLTEEYQWDGVRPRTDRTHDNPYSSRPELQNYGLVENSWPVRDENAIPHLFDTFLYRNSANIGSTPKEEGKRRAQVKSVESITEENAAVLQTPIDEVRFPVHMSEEDSLAYALTQLNDVNGMPTDVDLEKLAEEVCQKLQWHLLEG